GWLFKSGAEVFHKHGGCCDGSGGGKGRSWGFFPAVAAWFLPRSFRRDLARVRPARSSLGRLVEAEHTDLLAAAKSTRSADDSRAFPACNAFASRRIRNCDDNSSGCSDCDRLSKSPEL